MRGWMPIRDAARDYRDDSAGDAVCGKGEAMPHFVLALVALTVIVGVGLNILLGLAGQVSLGHVGFYAIGAYTVAILTVKGVSFWIALPLAGLDRGRGRRAARAAGLARHRALSCDGHHRLRLHRPARHHRMARPDRRRQRPDGSAPPTLGSLVFGEREIAVLASLLAGLSLYLFQRIAGSGWGKGMVAVRDSEIAARSIGLNPVIVKTAAFGLSAVLAGLAGGIFAPLMMFVAPDSFPFSQSILFLLAVIVGGAGWVFGPVLGAVVSVVLPEMLSGLAEYRLLFFGGLLIVVLWLAPEGVIGSLAGFWRRSEQRRPRPRTSMSRRFCSRRTRATLEVRGIGISFGGITAAKDVSFVAAAGEITSVIGPNGAGKTTVLNMIGGFYAPTAAASRSATRTRGRAGLEGGARRHRAHLSDHQAVRLDERRRQCSGRAAPRTARRIVLDRGFARRTMRRASAARVRRLSRCARHAGRRPSACRSPPGRDRARAGDAAARVAARRTCGRADALRQDCAQQAASPHRRSRHRRHPGRARHAAGDGHLGPSSCSMPARGSRAARPPRCDTIRACSRPISATAKCARARAPRPGADRAIRS